MTDKIEPHQENKKRNYFPYSEKDLDRFSFKRINFETVTKEDLIKILNDLLPYKRDDSTEVVFSPTWIEIRKSSPHGSSFMAVSSAKSTISTTIPNFSGPTRDELGTMVEAGDRLMFYGTSCDIPLKLFVEGLKMEDSERFQKDISQGIARAETYARKHSDKKLGDTSWLTLPPAKSVLIEHTLS